MGNGDVLGASWVKTAFGRELDELTGRRSKVFCRVVGRTESYGGCKVFLQREVPILDASVVAEIPVDRAMFDRLALGARVAMTLELEEP